MPLYFAYGSNMDRAAMTERCPGARAVGLARLERHRLAIMREGYATVVRDPRRAVLGLLWDLALSDMPALNRYEGAATSLYVKRQQPVVTTSGARKALIFIGSNTGPGTPLAGYLDGILAAARDVGFSEAALAEIASLGPGGGKATTSGPVVTVRPTRRNPHDPPRSASSLGWRWTP